MTVYETADKIAVTRHPFGLGGFALLAVLAGLGFWFVAGRTGQVASDLQPLRSAADGYSDALTWSSSREIRLQMFSVPAAAMVEEIAAEPPGSDPRRIDAAPSAGSPMPNAVPNTGSTTGRSATPVMSGAATGADSLIEKGEPGRAGLDSVPKPVAETVSDQARSSGAEAHGGESASVAAGLSPTDVGIGSEAKQVSPSAGGEVGSVVNASDANAGAVADGGIRSGVTADQALLKPSVETKARDPRSLVKGQPNRKRPAKAPATSTPEANRIQFGNVFE